MPDMPDIIGFFMKRKKFWLLPILIALMAMGALVFVSGTAISPFIYTIF
jgi:hypothetical protein